MMVGILSDKGNVRENNEDSVGFYKDDIKEVYIVADGMGGHNAGEVASKLAVDVILNYISSLEQCNYTQELLFSAIDEANKKVYEKSKENPKLNGMGTTVTACLKYNNKMFVANVGDSSCYIIKKNVISKVTKDHSLVQQLIDNGSITEQEALNHPNKNIITRALGINSFVEIDIFKEDIEDIEKVILCTDGLTNVVSDQEIKDIVLNNDNVIACEKLVELSKTNGSRDNISVIVFEGEGGNDRNYSRG